MLQPKGCNYHQGLTLSHEMAVYGVYTHHPVNNVLQCPSRLASNYSSSHSTTCLQMLGAVTHAMGQQKWHLGQGAHCPALISSVPGAAGTLKPALARSSLQRLARAWLDSSPDDSSLCTLPCTLQHHICLNKGCHVELWQQHDEPGSCQMTPACANCLYTATKMALKRG